MVTQALLVTSNDIFENLFKLFLQLISSFKQSPLLVNRHGHRNFMIKIRSITSGFHDVDNSIENGDDDSDKDGSEKIISGVDKSWKPGNFLQARIIATSYFGKFSGPIAPVFVELRYGVILKI